MKTLRAFREQLAPSFYNRVVLATTMWEKVPQDIGHKREYELCFSPNLWGDMIKQGFRVIRLPTDRQSALTLLDTFVRRDVKARFTAVGEGGISASFADEVLIENTLRRLQDERKARKEELSRKWKYSAQESHQPMISPLHPPTPVDSEHFDSENSFEN
jgi:hypothetical protein